MGCMYGFVVSDKHGTDMAATRIGPEWGFSVGMNGRVSAVILDRGDLEGLRDWADKQLAEDTRAGKGEG